jgi:hypothetical protein
MATEITFEVTDLHAEMLEESREIIDESAVNGSVEDFIHNLYKQAKQAEQQQQMAFEVEGPEERE